jgi:hypothetical protein
MEKTWTKTWPIDGSRPKANARVDKIGAHPTFGLNGSLPQRERGKGSERGQTGGWNLSVLCQSSPLQPSSSAVPWSSFCSTPTWRLRDRLAP